MDPRTFGQQSTFGAESSTLGAHYGASTSPTPSISTYPIISYHPGTQDFASNPSTMSWMASLGWKDGLSTIQLNKVEDLEKRLSRLDAALTQKQNKIDNLEQTVYKLKEKKGDDPRENGGILIELGRAEKKCQELEEKCQDIQEKLENKSKELEVATAKIKQFEGGSPVTSFDNAPLPTQANKSSFDDAPLPSRSNKSSFDDAPLPTQTNKSSFDDAPLPAKKSSIPLPAHANKFNPFGGCSSAPELNKATRGINQIANKHKGSSIAFDYSSPPPPPDNRRNMPGARGRPMPGGFSTPAEQTAFNPSLNTPKPTPHAPVEQTPVIPHSSTLNRSGDVNQGANLQMDNSKIEECKKQLQESTLRVSNLESCILRKDQEVAKLRLEFGAAKSDVETLEAELRSQGSDIVKKEESLERLKAELDKQGNKANDLEEKIVKLQQELQCQRHNADASKNQMDFKLKEQEKELKLENSQIATSLTQVTKQLDDKTKKLEQVDAASKLKESSLKAQVDKLETAMGAKEKELNQVNTKLNQAENANVAKEKTLEETSKKVKEITKEKDMMVNKVSTVELKLISLEKAMDSSKNQTHQKDNVIQSLKEKYEAMEKESVLKTKEMEKEKNKLQNEISTAEAKLKEMATEKEKTRSLKEKSEAMEKESVLMKKDMEVERKKLKEMTTEKEKTEDLFAKYKTSAEEKLNRIEEDEAKLKQMITEKEKTEDLFAKYKTSTEDKLNRIEEFEAAAQKCKSEVDAMNEKISEMNKKVQDTEEVAEMEKGKAEKAVEEKLATELKMWDLTEKVEILKTEKDAFEQEMGSLKNQKDEIEKLLQEKTENMTAITIENQNLNDSMTAISLENKNINENILKKEEDLVLSKSEKDLCEQEIGTLKNKKNELEKLLQENSENMKTISIENKNLNEKVNQLSSQILKKEEDLTNKITENQEMVCKMEKVVCDLHAKNDEAKHLALHINSLTKELDNKTKRVEEVLNNFSLAEKENEALHATAGAALANVIDKLVIIKSLEDNFKISNLALEETINGLKLEKITLIGNVEAYEKDLAEMADEKENLQALAYSSQAKFMELSIQMEGLEKQKNEAAENFIISVSECEATIESLTEEKTSYQTELCKLKQQFEEFKVKSQQNLEELEGANEKLTSNEAKMETLSKMLENSDCDNKDKSRAIVELENMKKQLEDKLQEVAEEKEDIQAMAYSSQAKFMELSMQMEGLEKQKNEAAENFINSVSDCEATIENLTEEKTSYQTELCKLKQQFEEFKQKSEQSLEELEGANKKLTSNEAKMETLFERLENLDTDSNKKTKTIVDLQNMKKQLEDEKVDLQALAYSSQEKFMELSIQMEVLEKKKNEAAENFIISVSECEATIESLKEEKKISEDYANDLSNQLEAAKEEVTQVGHEVSEIKSALVKTENQLENLKTDMEQNWKQKIALEEKFSQEQKQNLTLYQTVNSLQSVVDSYKDLEEQSTSFQEKINQLEIELKQSEDIKDKSNDTNMELRAKLLDTEQTLSAQISELEEKIVINEKSVNNEQEQILKLKDSELSQALTRLEIIQMDLEALQSEKSEFSSNFEVMEQARSSAELDRDECREALKKSEEFAIDLSEQLKVAKEGISKSEEEVALIISAASLNESQLDNLRTDVDLRTKQIEELLENEEMLTSQMREFEEKIEANKTSVQMSDVEKQGLKERITQLEGCQLDKIDLQKKVEKFNFEIDGLKIKLVNSEEKLKEATSEVLKIKSQKEELEENIKTCEESVEKLIGNVESLEKDLADKNILISEMRQKSIEVAEEKKDIQAMAYSSQAKFNELSIQMECLEKQKNEAAENFINSVSDCEATIENLTEEKTSYQTELCKLKQQFEEFKQKSEQSLEELEGANEKLTSNEAKMETLEMMKKQLEEKLQQEVTEKLSSMDGLNLELTLLRENSRKFELEVEKLTKDIDETKVENQLTVEKLQQEVEKLTKDIEEQEAIYDSQETKIAQLQTNNANLLNNMTNQDEFSATKLEEFNKLTIALEQKHNALEKVEKELLNYQEQILKLTRESTEAKEDLQAMAYSSQAKFMELSVQMEGLEKQKNEAAENFIISVSECEATIESLTEEKTSYQTELCKLKQQLEEFKQKSEQSLEELERANEKLASNGEHILKLTREITEANSSKQKLVSELDLLNTKHSAVMESLEMSEAKMISFLKEVDEKKEEFQTRENIEQEYKKTISNQECQISTFQTNLMELELKLQKKMGQLERETCLVSDLKLEKELFEKKALDAVEEIKEFKNVMEKLSEELQVENSAFVSKIEKLRQENTEQMEAQKIIEQEMRAHFEQEIAIKSENLKTTSEELSSRNERNCILQNELSDAKEELEKVIMEKCDIETEKQEIGEELIALQGKCKVDSNEKENNIKKMEKEIEEIKIVLEESKSQQEKLEIEKNEQEKNQHNLANEIESLKIELTSAKQAVLEKESEWEEIIQKQKETLSLEVSALQSESNEKENQIIEMGEKLQDAFSECENMKKSQAKLEKDLSDKEAELKLLQAECQTERQDKKDLHNLANEIEALKIELTSAKQANVEKNSEWEEAVQKQKETFSLEISSLQSESNEKEKEIIEMGEKLQDVYSECENMKKSQAKLEKDLSDKEADFKLLEAECQTERQAEEQKIKHHMETIFQANEEIAKLHSSIEMHAIEKRSVEEKIKILEKERDDLQIVLDEKEKVEESIGSDLKMVKKELLEEKECKLGLVEKLATEEKRWNAEREVFADEKAAMETQLNDAKLAKTAMETQLKDAKLAKTKELEDANEKLAIVTEEKLVAVNEMVTLRVTLEEVELAKLQLAEELDKLKMIEDNLQQVEQKKMKIEALNKEMENELKNLKISKEKQFDELNQTKKEVEDSSVKVDLITKEKFDLVKQLQEAMEAVSDGTQKLNETKSELCIQKTNLMEKIKQDKVKFEEQIETLKQNLTSANSLKAEKENLATTLENEKVKFEEQVETLQQNLINANSLKTEKENLATTLENEKVKFEEQVETLQQNLINANSLKTEKENLATTLENEKVKFEEQVETLQQNLINANSLKAEKEHLAKTFESEKVKFEEQIKTLEQNIINANSIKAEKETLLKTLGNEKENMAKEIKSLEKEKAEMVQQKMTIVAEKESEVQLKIEMENEIANMKNNSAKQEERIEQEIKIREENEKSHVSKVDLLLKNFEEQIETSEKEKSKLKEQIEAEKEKLLEQMTAYESIKMENETLTEKAKNSLPSHEVEDLKSKLQLSISNAKRKEKEFEQIEALLASFEEENTTLKEAKTTLKRSSARLLKQVDALKSDLDKFNDEAAKASASPWEEDDWEGLSHMEIYNLMKDELVPAQQARLGRQCIIEMEDKVKAEQMLFIKAAAEIDTLKDLNTKLSAKITFLEVAQKAETPEKEPKKMDKNLASRLLKTMTAKKTGSMNITPLKKTAAQKAPKKTPVASGSDEISTRRRSSRISSGTNPLPNLSTTVPLPQEISILDDEENRLSKTLNVEPKPKSNPSVTDNYLVKDITPTRKRFISTLSQDDDEEEVEKRMKIKTTDSSSPAKVSKVKMSRPRLNAIPSLASHSNPLSNQTNSPSKVNPAGPSKVIRKPEDGAEGSENPNSSGVLTRTRNRGKADKSRSKEECKQQ